MSRNSAPNSFTPLSLFSASEPGFWYDYSDFSTLFQDINGVTPVTATGQAVGAGVHEVQRFPTKGLDTFPSSPLAQLATFNSPPAAGFNQQNHQPAREWGKR